MRIVFSGGGTAGHINPALAVAKYVLEKDPGAQVLFVGTTHGIENTLVKKAGYTILGLDIAGIKRSLSPANAVALLKAAAAFEKSKRILKKYKPDIVVGTGGYVCWPVVAAAARMKIPTLVHESNVFAGMATKALSPITDTVAIAFENTRSYLPRAKNTVLTGNPVRRELLAMSKEDARKRVGAGERPFIVAFGGSLGAAMLNTAVIDMLCCFKGKEPFDLLLATGERYFDDVKKRLSDIRGIGDNVRVVPYIYNMDEAMSAADIMICRGGAMTVSEITALGKASVLIPSPNVTDNHQEYNARVLEKAGAAAVITEGELVDEKILYKKIYRLVNDKKTLNKMEECSFKMGIINGTEKIYNEIIALITAK